MQPILQVEHLKKEFLPSGWFSKNKPFVAVNDISFSVAKGEIVGLLGPNGAGKSTTMQMLLGTLTPTSGVIRYFGKSLAQHRVSIMKQLGYATAYARLPKRLTVRENLRIYALCYGFSDSEVNQAIERTLKAFDAYHLIDKEAHGLSAGQTTRILLAKAFLGNPEIVLLDEPTASLDPDVVEIVRHFLLDQRRTHGVSILLASHDMSEVAEVCDRLLVLKDGELIAQDTPMQLARTVRMASLQLIIEHGLDKAINLANEKKYTHRVVDKELTVHLNEQDISNFLMLIAYAGVSYSHISLEKPTLEDYFLTIARKRTI